jgi:hypothetical protein
LEKLIIVLAEQSDLSYATLYSWKDGHHRSTPKEAYAWRAVLEEIKASNLSAKCASHPDREQAMLMADKPAMLKIAGEITNGLMHSYASGHRITLSQRVLKVPS